MVLRCFTCRWPCNKQPKRAFFGFPKEEDTRNKWLEILGKTKEDLRSRNSVCSMHFEEKCFRYGLVYGKVLLKEGSLPSLNIQNKNVSPKMYNKNRDILEKVVTDIGLDKDTQNETAVLTGLQKEKATAQSCLDENIQNPTQASLVNIQNKSSSQITVMITTSKQNFDANAQGKFQMPQIQNANLNNKRANEIDDIHKTAIIYLKRKLTAEKMKNTKLKRLVEQLRKSKLKWKEESLARRRQMKKQAKPTQPVKLTFGHTILEELGSPKKKTSHSSLPLKVFASTAASLSLKTYKYLRETFPVLPHSSTLRKWRNKIDIQPGTCAAVLNVLREKHDQAKKNGKTLLCSIMIDDIIIGRNLRWNGKKFVRPVKSQKAPRNSNTNKKMATVVMVVCLNENWKLPVAYHFIESLDGEQRANILFDCLKAIHPTGVNIVSLTFNGGPSNITMSEKLGATFLYTENFDLFIKHPITSKPIFIVYDACHALKLVRNTLSNEKVLIDHEDNRIEWKYFQILVQIQNQYELHTATKVRKRHINYWPERTKVNLAAELFSCSTYNAMKFLRMDVNMPDFENSSATEMFCLVINNIFDLLNSGQAFVKDLRKNSITPQNVASIKAQVYEYEQYIMSLRLGDVPILESKRKLGFYGLIISMHSVIAIFEKYALSDSPLEYMLTHKFSLENLELLFSFLKSKRRRNNNLTTYQFELALKSLLIYAQNPCLSF